MPRSHTRSATCGDDPSGGTCDQRHVFRRPFDLCLKGCRYHATRDEAGRMTRQCRARATRDWHSLRRRRYGSPGRPGWSRSGTGAERFDGVRLRNARLGAADEGDAARCEAGRWRVDRASSPPIRSTDTRPKRPPAAVPPDTGRPPPAPRGIAPAGAHRSTV